MQVCRRCIANRAWCRQSADRSDSDLGLLFSRTWGRWCSTVHYWAGGAFLALAPYNFRRSKWAYFFKSSSASNRAHDRAHNNVLFQTHTHTHIHEHERALRAHHSPTTRPPLAHHSPTTCPPSASTSSTSSTSTMPDQNRSQKPSSLSSDSVANVCLRTISLVNRSARRWMASTPDSTRVCAATPLRERGTVCAITLYAASESRLQSDSSVARSICSRLKFGEPAITTASYALRRNASTVASTPYAATACAHRCSSSKSRQSYPKRRSSCAVETFLALSCQMLTFAACKALLSTRCAIKNV